MIIKRDAPVGHHQTDTMPKKPDDVWYYIARSEPSGQSMLHKGLARRGLEFFAPMVTISQRCGRGGMRTVRRFYTQGYTFVKLLDHRQHYLLIETPGFLSLMRAPGGDGYVVLLPPALDLIRRVSQSTVKEAEELPFKVGQFVRVVDGPFSSFPGEITEISANGRTKVEVDIFGRSTPVELDTYQLTALDVEPPKRIR